MVTDGNSRILNIEGHSKNMSAVKSLNLALNLKNVIKTLNFKPSDTLVGSAIVLGSFSRSVTDPLSKEYITYLSYK